MPRTMHANEYFHHPVLIPLLPIELSLSSYLFPLLDRQPILAFEEKDLYLNHDAPLP